MTISPFDLILLLGSLQGFILASLLWVNRQGNRLSNRLLASLISLLALASLAVGIPVSNKWISLMLDIAPLINTMPLGPLLYFYVKSLLDPTFRLGRAERLQFYPVVVDWGSKFIIWTFFIGAFLGLIDWSDGPAWGGVINEYNTYSDIPRWLSMMIYLVLAYRWVRQYVPAGSVQEVERQQQTLRWLRSFLTVLLVFQAIWLVHLIPYIIPGTRSTLLDAVGWYPIYVPITVLIYWLGLRGYLYARNSAVQLKARKVSAAGLPPVTTNHIIDLLTRAMETDQLFLDPELTVEKVSRHVTLPAKTISFVLNQHQQKSFNTFINEYRVSAVKQRLTSVADEHLTLTGIAFECGFNSQATFQRVFRQMTGVSPTEFLGRQAAELEK